MAMGRESSLLSSRSFENREKNTCKMSISSPSDRRRACLGAFFLIAFCVLLNCCTPTEAATTAVKVARTNSRFLRTFPPYEFLKYAHKDGNGQRFGNTIPEAGLKSKRTRLDNGNSPVFYIRLPPAPYVLVPGLGYVSPHPYNSPMSPMSGMGMGLPGPMMMSPASSMSVMDFPEEDELPPQNVNYLPLKFLSNGRPAQIESPKKKKTKPANSSYNQVSISSENSIDKSNTANLISGGKYSFNGRPTAVFVVRSPAI